MSDVWDKVKLNAEITRLREENARLREILGDVSRGVQMYRTDINIAAVWLPAIQAVNQYFRDSDETAAIREGEA